MPPGLEPGATGLDTEHPDLRVAQEGVEQPMELLPPPTQATRLSGMRPSTDRNCSRASWPMTAWKSRTIAG